MPNLVLSRKAGQRLFIDGELIKLTVVSVNQGRVRLGIEAPKEVKVVREEVLKERKESQ